MLQPLGIHRTTATMRPLPVMQSVRQAVLPPWCALPLILGAELACPANAVRVASSMCTVCPGSKRHKLLLPIRWPPRMLKWLQDPPSAADNWLRKQQHPRAGGSQPRSGHQEMARREHAALEEQDAGSSEEEDEEEEEDTDDESDDEERAAALEADQNMQHYGDGDEEEAGSPTPRSKGRGTAVSRNNADLPVKRASPLFAHCCLSFQGA